MSVTILTDELTGYGDVECIGLAGQAFDLQARCDAVLKTRRAVKLVELKAQHEAKILARRQHGERLRVLEAQGREIESTDQQLRQDESKCLFDLRVLRGQKPRDEYTLEEERKLHGRKVADLEKQLEKIHRQKFDLNGARGTWVTQAEEANQKLAQLDLEVQNLFDEIQLLETGKRPLRHSRETGLWTGTPSSVMG